MAVRRDGSRQDAALCVDKSFVRIGQRFSCGECLTIPGKAIVGTIVMFGMVLLVKDGRSTVGAIVGEEARGAAILHVPGLVAGRRALPECPRAEEPGSINVHLTNGQPQVKVLVIL
jgi:hypothetical protein